MEDELSGTVKADGDPRSQVMGTLENAALEAFRARNESLPDCLVFHLTDRGFFAEFNDVARAAIYAWENDLQLLLDSTRFAFRIERGWEDYFEPFCRSAQEVDPARVRKRFEFNPQRRDRTPTRPLQVFRTQELRIGGLHLTGFSKVLDFVQRMIFRLTATRARQVARLIEGLSLPERYLAVHVRRGDKIGDEDFYYPAEAYLQSLGEIPNETPIFVMSDDYAAVEEMRRALALYGMQCRVATLAAPHDNGFDVNRLRRGEHFMSKADFDREPDRLRYKEEATVRLLADMAVARNAARAVSTARSFVGIVLKALNSNPTEVKLLRFDDAREFITPKLRAGRHVLDAYKKVLLIRIGHHGAGFFAYVQFALNQIQYCERHGYLPVVHYNADHGNHFFDSVVGEDMWEYYFEPVAGYTKADIDAALADKKDPLSSAHIIQLPDNEIMRLCQFDPQSIFHYTYGCWREHPPDDPDAWYAAMRRKGHRYVSQYIKIKRSIRDEIDRFFARHMKKHQVLGVHIRGTDMRYAPPVPLQRFCDEIDSRLGNGFDRVFVATDQQQYLEALKDRYGDQLIYQDCQRSTDARNPMWLDRPSPAVQGKEVLVDAVLLSRCRFMLKSPSAVSEFAHYFIPTLKSLDLNQHRTEYAGQDYTKPGLGYSDYPKAWDLVGNDIERQGGRSKRETWVEPLIRRGG